MVYNDWIQKHFPEESWELSVLSFRSVSAGLWVKTGPRAELWLEEWRWAREWAMAAVITVQLRCQRVFCWLSRARTKTSPEKKKTTLLPSQCSPWLLANTFNYSRALSTTYFLLYLLSAQVGYNNTGRVQLQSYYVFWNAFRSNTSTFFPQEAVSITW